ncbi:hypothetical protein IE81DRAFT_366773 [Ceraceosorus guamensis]|uniref:Uncharacterized protein n=1 Tax=Ceraceosorus guamensis TaxID=1522189 RepID=A0A316W0V4_9BASI|nr:hypothetical protein IE81DRAFT_366773 [Ceraceosorus guamensis]PWN42181.1 hypothetical protein IE81DRAFT_366773 [Ceraceosorus guamensis]
MDPSRSNTSPQWPPVWRAHAPEARWNHDWEHEDLLPTYMTTQMYGPTQLAPHTQGRQRSHTAHTGAVVSGPTPTAKRPRQIEDSDLAQFRSGPIPIDSRARSQTIAAAHSTQSGSTISQMSGLQGQNHAHERRNAAVELLPGPGIHAAESATFPTEEHLDAIQQTPYSLDTRVISEVLAHEPPLPAGFAGAPTPNVNFERHGFLMSALCSRTYSGKNFTGLKAYVCLPPHDRQDKFRVVPSEGSTVKQGSKGQFHLAIEAFPNVRHPDVLEGGYALLFVQRKDENDHWLFDSMVEYADDPKSAIKEAVIGHLQNPQSDGGRGRFLWRDKIKDASGSPGRPLAFLIARSALKKEKDIRLCNLRLRVSFHNRDGSILRDEDGRASICDTNEFTWLSTKTVTNREASGSAGNKKGKRLSGAEIQNDREHSGTGVGEDRSEPHGQRQDQQQPKISIEALAELAKSLSIGDLSRLSHAFDAQLRTRDEHLSDRIGLRPSRYDGREPPHLVRLNSFQGLPGHEERVAGVAHRLGQLHGRRDAEYVGSQALNTGNVEGGLARYEQILPNYAATTAQMRVEFVGLHLEALHARLVGMAGFMRASRFTCAWLRAVGNIYPDFIGVDSRPDHQHVVYFLGEASHPEIDIGTYAQLYPLARHAFTSRVPFEDLERVICKPYLMGLQEKSVHDIWTDSPRSGDGSDWMPDLGQHPIPENGSGYHGPWDSAFASTTWPTTPAPPAPQSENTTQAIWHNVPDSRSQNASGNVTGATTPSSQTASSSGLEFSHLGPENRERFDLLMHCIHLDYFLFNLVLKRWDSVRRLEVRLLQEDAILCARYPEAFQPLPLYDLSLSPLDTLLQRS